MAVQRGDVHFVNLNPAQGGSEQIVGHSGA